MKRLEHMKETLVSCVSAEFGDLKNADAQELGAAVDMIKDLEEAIYYHTITKAMNEPKHQMMQQKMEHQPHRQEPMYYPDTRYNDEWAEGRAYYSGQGSSGSNGMNSQNGGSSTRNYHDPMMRDPMEGRSPMYRKMYMESKKANGPDAAKNAKELEEYVHELTEDIMEMIEDASVEEKQMLRQKISLLANKIK
jgi:hypothetical protein